MQLAKAYNRLGAAADASATALLAVRRHPSSPAAFNGAGWLLALEGRAHEAVEVLRRGRRLHPRDPHIPFHLGKAYADLGQPARAAAALRAARRLDPASAEAALLLGLALFDGADGSALRPAYHMF